MTQKPQIAIHRFFPPDTTIFDPSPFVTKLECLLRMSSTPYTLVQTDVRKAPLHKLPFITLSTGQTFPDSTLAYTSLLHLDLISHPAPSDSLPLEKAQSTLLQSYLEHWIYFLWCWEKYVDNWRVTRSTLFARFIPFAPLRVIVYHFVYRDFKKMLYGMGITRFERAQILEFIEQAAGTLATLVGGGFGERRSMVDATVFGFLVAINEAGEMTPVWGREIAKYPELMRWLEEMGKEYFPEREIRESVG